jgi:2-methylisocitrate lyase-like PEP mutase family enzyme
MIDTAAKRAAFRSLHRQGCFVLPNPWDRGSARLLQHLGFLALASTSSGAAWSSGRPDYAVTREDALFHLAQLCAATDLPVNADFESGFADAPEGVAANVALAIQTGIAGLSIEDRRLDGGGLYDSVLAVERIRAARAAIAGENVILVARTEGLLSDASQIGAAIDRLVVFADAGADCLYAPGVQKREDIAAMVKAVAPKPVNVLMAGPGLTLGELADLGVRRVSIGGALARVAWGAMLKVAEEIKRGSFEGLASGTPGKTLNGIFGEFKAPGCAARTSGD